MTIDVDRNTNDTHISDISNYTEYNEIVYYEKSQETNNMWLINFPAVITTKKMMLTIHKYIKDNINGMAFEAAMTVSWFALKYNVTYKVYLCLKKVVLESKELTLENLYNNALILTKDTDKNFNHPSLNRNCIGT